MIEQKDIKNASDISENRIHDFLQSIKKEEDKDILDLKNYAIKYDVPIIKDDTKDFLRLLLSIKKPIKVLELGTAIAYSTLIIYRECREYIESIVTVENYEKRIIEAKKNIGLYHDKNIVHLIEEDIDVYLKTNDCREEFDFIFLDAAKAQYIVWLPYIKRFLKKDGILFSDNIFKDGEILESKWLIEKRDRTIHKRMRDFIHTIMRDDDFNTQIFNIGDGISVSIKK